MSKRREPTEEGSVAPENMPSTESTVKKKPVFDPTAEGSVAPENVPSTGSTEEKKPVSVSTDIKEQTKDWETDSESYEALVLEMMYDHYAFYDELEYNDYITRGSVLSCSCGTHKKLIDLLEDHGVYTENGNPVMTCKDCKSGTNIPNFGICKGQELNSFLPKTENITLYIKEDSKAPYPINGHQCMPILDVSWIQTYRRTRINEGDGKEYEPALLARSTLVCMYGGWIEVIEVRDVPTNTIMNIPVYFQNDYPNDYFGYKGKGGKTIAAVGCGPTSMAMIITYFTGETVTPPDVATWGPQYYSPGEGAYHTLIPEASEHWGLKCKKIDASADTIYAELKAGHPIVALMGKGTFTGGGHFIVLRGYTDEKKILVNDPNKKNHNFNEREFDVSIIINEKKKLWSIWKE